MKSEYGWQLTREHACAKPFLWFAKAGQQWRCGREMPGGERCGRLWEVTVDQNHGNPKKLKWTEVPGAEPTGRLERFAPAREDEILYWVAHELSDIGEMQAVMKGGERFPIRQVIEAVQKHFTIGKVQ